MVVAGLLALAVLAGTLLGAGVAGPGWFGLGGEDAKASVAVPNLPAPQPAKPALGVLDGSADQQVPLPTRAGLARVLGPGLTSAALGGAASAVVTDLATGEVLYSRAETVPAIPGSTAKLVTAVAALAALGPTARLTTRVVAGAQDGQIVLVGGGDPTLTAGPPIGDSRLGYPALARMADLAAATAKAVTASGTTSVRLVYDDSLFTGPADNPAWKRDYVPHGNVAEVTALTVDEARLRRRTDDGTDPRSPNPSKSAATAFAKLLAEQGVRVTGVPSRGKAAADAKELAAVSSPPVSALVEYALTESDNDLTEALLRHVAIKKGGPASFTGGAAAARQVLADLGVDVTGLALFDGSGLSRRNRISARTLGQVLAVAASADHPELRPALTGLPIAAFSGTLDDRFLAGGPASAAGVVRAKTGTLTGVSSLAGVVRTADGRLLGFAFLTDRVPGGATLQARTALDRLAAAVAACGCS